MSAPEAIAQIWAWSLIHFLWQGCLLGGLAWLVLRMLGRATPEARYAVACLGLALMVAAPVATGLVLRARTAATAPVMAVSSKVRVDVDFTDAAPTAPSLSARLQPALPWILGLWAAGVALLSLRLLGGWAWMQRLRHAKATRAEDEWQTLVRVLSRRLGLARDVLLMVCDRIESPIALGWIRPVILIPPALLTGLEPLALEAILLHELAHIRRQDYLVNLLQSVAETLLFYHPAVWWLSAAIRQERENACDDAAIRHTGDAVAYARTLSFLEEYRMNTHAKISSTPAPAATGGSLIARVRRILAPTPAVAPAAPRAVVLGLLAAGLLGAASTGPRPKDETKVAPEAPTVKTEKHVVVVTADGKSGDDVKVVLKLRGEAKLDDIRQDFARMSPGSKIHISEKGKTFVAERNSEGAYTETYTVDGKTEPITGDVRTWAQGRLPDKVGVHTVHGGHGVKVIAGGDSKVVVHEGGEDGKGRERVIIVRKHGGEGDGPHVLKFKRGGADPDIDMDMDFDFDVDLKHEGFEWTPEMKEKMEKLHKELGGKMRIEMKELKGLKELAELKELHKLGPEIRLEIEKHHKLLGEGSGDGKAKVFTFTSRDGDFAWDSAHGKEIGQKARMKALKGLAEGLARDADDAETKAALGRIRAEIEALEAKHK